MSERINAPFTASQIQRIRLWQACDWIHSLTCNGDTIQCRRDGSPSLSVEPMGLVCRKCGYTQTWAPAACLEPLPPQPFYSGWRKAERDWEVRSYYGEDHPTTPYALARHEWQCGDHTKDMDVEIAMKRADIGFVEVRRVIDGVPQAWVVVKPPPDGKG